MRETITSTPPVSVVVPDAMYDAVVFDNDGVLVGPTDLAVLRRATREAFASLDVSDLDEADVELLTHGVRRRDLETICASYDLEPETFWRVRDRFSADAQMREMIAGNKAPYPDVDALDAIDAPLGLVSSNQQATIEFLLERFSLRSRFATAHGRKPTVADLDRKKPATHYVRKALRDLDAETALFVGDSDVDIEAAHAAGLDSAFVRRPHRRDHVPSVEPTHEVAGLDDLLALARVPTRPSGDDRDPRRRASRSRGV